MGGNVLAKMNFVANRTTMSRHRLVYVRKVVVNK